MLNEEYEEKSITGSKSFGLAPIEKDWDGSAAETKIKKWASSDGSGDKDKINWNKLGSAYVYKVAGEDENIGSYKFPFVDIIGDTPKIVFKALSAIIGAVNGARGGTKIPDADKKKVYNFAASLYKKFEKEPPEYGKSIEDDLFEQDDLITTEYEAKYAQCPFNIKSDSITEDGTFEGYASVFGGRPDSYGDVIAPGAFGETLSKGGRNRNGIAMVWYHDPKQPIGIWKSIVQDDKGLKVIGQLNLDVQRAREIHSLMKQGAIKGLSIGWDFMKDANGKIVEGTWEYKDEQRTKRLLKQIELWEISPVTFPAKLSANITKVKSMSIENASTERELEEALRESGLTKHAAQCMIKLVKNSLRESEDKNVGNLESDNSGELIKSQIGETIEDVKTQYSEILSKLKSVNTELKIHSMCN